MAVATYKLKTSANSCRLVYGSTNQRVRWGENVEIDFAVGAQSDAVTAAGKSIGDFDVEGVQPAHHKPFA